MSKVLKLAEMRERAKRKMKRKSTYNGQRNQTFSNYLMRNLRHSTNPSSTKKASHSRLQLETICKGCKSRAERASLMSTTSQRCQWSGRSHYSQSRWSQPRALSSCRKEKSMFALKARTTARYRITAYRSKLKNFLPCRPKSTSISLRCKWLRKKNALNRTKRKSRKIDESQ